MANPYHKIYYRNTTRKGSRANASLEAVAKQI